MDSVAAHRYRAAARVIRSAEFGRHAIAIARPAGAGHCADRGPLRIMPWLADAEGLATSTYTPHRQVIPAPPENSACLNCEEPSDQRSLGVAAPHDRVKRVNRPECSGVHFRLKFGCATMLGQQFE